VLQQDEKTTLASLARTTACIAAWDARLGNAQTSIVCVFECNKDEQNQTQNLLAS